MIDLIKIRSTAYEIWDFIFPPLINIGLIFLLHFLVSNDHSFLPIKIPTTLFSNLKESNIQEFLEYFKISALMPVLFVIMFTYAIHLINSGCYFIGSLFVPVNIYFINVNVYFSTYRFTSLWGYFPSLKSKYELASMIDKFCAEETLKKSSIGKMFESYDKQIDMIRLRIAFFKFILLFSLGLLISNIFLSNYNTTLLLFMVILIICCIIFYFLKLVAKWKQLINYRVEIFYISKKLQEPELTDELKAAHMKKIEPVLGEGRGWWMIYFGYPKGYWWITLLKNISIPHTFK